MTRRIRVGQYPFLLICICGEFDIPTKLLTRMLLRHTVESCQSNGANRESEMAAWNVAGAVAMQSEAHDRMTKALETKQAFFIYQGDCHITTASSLSAAKMWVGKSKKYTIVPMAQA